MTLLHAPYTAWHLSYVVVGGCLVAEVPWGRLGPRSSPSSSRWGSARTHSTSSRAGRSARPSRAVLIALAIGSVAAACALGVAVALDFSLWLLPLIAVGAFLVPAYNLELFGGRFHSDPWFGLAWGAFPVVTAYVACAGTLRLAAVLAAGWATVLSLAQRRLSTPVRAARRRLVAVTGELELQDGTRAAVTPELLVAAPEAALRLLTLSTLLIAAALVTLRL